MKRLTAPAALILTLLSLFLASTGANCDADLAGLNRFLTPTRSSTIALTTDDRFLLVANRETDTVSLIEVRDEDGNDVQNKIAEIAVGDEPRFLALTPDNATAFVTNTASGTVTVLSLLGENPLDFVAEIPVGAEPRGCAVSPNGTRLVVANHTSKSVSIIDTGSLSVLATIDVGGNPQAIAITNDGDDEDDDEEVFVTLFYARLIDGGNGEAFDDGKEGVVRAFNLGNAAASLSEITLSPLADSGFTASRNLFCTQLNGAAVNDTFCPDTNENDANEDVIAEDPQGAFPNQLHAALIRGDRLFIPNTGAAPEPPIVFNVNVQALVHVVSVANLAELVNEHVNINAQIKLETQPDEAVEKTVLDRLFGNDLVAIDADADGNNFVIVSRGGNYVIRAILDADGKLNINAPDSVVRFQTGNLPNGVVLNSDATRAYTNNEVGISVSALNLETNTVIARDIASGQDPEPGTFNHGVLVGKLCFFSALGVPDDGIFGTPIRDIIPLESRNKMSDNAWSSCASCHPDGHSDGVTWIFATGPRNTIALDGFFAKDNPADQRVSNYNAVRSSVTDFNENSVAVQGGIGFAGDPPDGQVFNHGISQGASDALDAQTLWVQTVRAPILPEPNDLAAFNRGADIFEDNCASCHGGAKWTKSQILYAANPAFDSDPNAGGAPRDPGITNAAAQIISLTVGAETLIYLEDVGTFDPNSPIEIRNNGTGALGVLGFNVPSLLGTAYHAPYFHDGSAQTLPDVFPAHELPGGGTIASNLSAAEEADLLVFLNALDGATNAFESEADDFKAAITGN